MNSGFFHPSVGLGIAAAAGALLLGGPGISAIAQESFFRAPDIRLSPISKRAGGGLDKQDETVQTKEDRETEAALQRVEDEETRLKTLREIEELLVKYPDNYRLRMGKGMLFIRMNRHQEAIEILEALLADFPDSVSVKNNLAWVYATAGDGSMRDGQRAVLLGREALLSKPMNYHIWSTVGEGHYISGDFVKALKAAREALRIGVELEADAENILEYRRQMRKSVKALIAFSLIE